MVTSVCRTQSIHEREISTEYLQVWGACLKAAASTEEIAGRKFDEELELADTCAL